MQETFQFRNPHGCCFADVVLHYIFDDDVRAMEGVGRFVIGLASDITIIEGTELREYIRNFVSRHLEKV